MSSTNFNPPSLERLPEKKLATTTHVNEVIDAVNAQQCSYVLGESRPYDTALDNSFLKLSSPWSSNTANVAIGHECAAIDGSGASTNTIAIGLFTPATYRPRSTPLKTNDVIAFAPFSGTVAGGVFGGGTNTIYGIAIDAPEDVGQVYCLLAQTGGSAGGSASACTYLYTATDPTYGTTLGTSLAPTAPRLAMITMNAATNGTGQWMPSGTNRVFSLTQAFESAQQENCG